MKQVKMKRKNGQKLLAAFAILAMVACVFASAAPAADADDPVAMSKDISKADDILVPVASETEGKTADNWTYNSTSKIITLTGETTWVLKDNITLDIVQLNLDGKKLTVKSATASDIKTLTITATGSAITKELIDTGATQSTLNLEDVNLALNYGSDSNKANGNMIGHNSGAAKITVNATDASINISCYALHSVFESAQNAVIFNLTDSTLDITGNVGTQNETYNLVDSEFDADVDKASITGYFNLDNSSVESRNINVYSAKLANGSTMVAEENLGIYSKNSGTGGVGNAYTLASITMDSSSSIASKKIWDGQYSEINGTSITVHDKTPVVTFIGGTVGGDLINYNEFKDATKNEIRTTYTFDGTTFVGGNITANVDFKMGTNGFVIDGNVNVLTDGAFTDVSKICYISGDSIITGVTYTGGSLDDAILGIGAKIGDYSEEAETQDAVEVSSVGVFNNVASAPGAVVNITGAIALDQDVVLGEGATVGGSGAVTLGNNVIKVPSGAVSGLKVIGGSDGSSAIITLAGNFTIKAGSVYLDGNLQGGTINLTDGTGVITGVVTEDTTFTGTGIFNIENLTVNPGVTLTLENGPTYNVKATTASQAAFYLYGDLMSTNGTTLTVAANATFKAFAGANIKSNISIVGVAGDKTSVIDLADAMSTVTIDQNVASDMNYSQTQTVIIQSSLTLNPGTKTVVKGKLIINEGVVLTVSKNAVLEMNDSLAQMIVDGKIEIMKDGLVDVKSAKDVIVSGAIDAEGDVTINSTVKVNSGGEIFVDDEAKITVGKGLTIETGGELEIRGTFLIDEVANKGTVIFNGATIGKNSVVSLAADGAIVDMKSFHSAATEYSLTINDDGLVFSTNPAVSVGSPATYVENEIVIPAVSYGGIKGLTITESVSSVTKYGTTTYYNKLLLEGSVSIVDENPAPTITAYSITSTGPAVDVIGDLVIGAGVTLDFSSTTSVTGSIVATATDSVVKSTSGSITVDGMIQAITAIANNINAFMYEDDVDSVPYFFYTTLATAIENGATEIDALGATTILESVTVPTETQVKAATGATIVIGSTGDRTVTVVFNDGAQLRNATVSVLGTLTFDNKKDNKSNLITSDVKVEDEVSITFTNIYTALNEAEEGNVITINGDIEFDKDAEIKTGVTLAVPSGKTATVNDGVTLTVNGTLKNSGSVVAQTKFAIEASETDKTSVILVNGAFMQMGTAIDYGTYMIAGAYYNIVNTDGNWYYVTPVEQAAAVSDDVTGGIIQIFGKNKVGDVTFTGDKDQAVTVTIKAAAPTPGAYAAASLEAGAITLVYASLDVDGWFTGSVASANGTVDVINMTNVIASASMVDKEEVFSITGTPAKADVDGAKATVTIATGDVYVIGTLDLTSASLDKFVISEGATMTVSNAGSKVEATAMTVNGTLVAYNAGEVKVTTLSVVGTFTVAPADSVKGVAVGKAAVVTMYVGIDKDKDLGSNAIVNAESINGLKTAYVAADATISEDLIKALPMSTAFYVENELWMTVYTKDAVAITDATSTKIIPADVGDAVFKNWQVEDSDGKLVDLEKDKNVGAVDKVYAELNYDIYKVILLANEGIADVAIDGNLMTYGLVADMSAQGLVYAYTAIVDAGVHEVKYTLKNGYSGEAKLIVNGVAASGLTFTTEGDELETVAPNAGYKVYNLQLSGIEKSGYTPESPDASSDDGMTLTEILLIVLVVLILIMAIIVAMRMMRS